MRLRRIPPVPTRLNRGNGWPRCLCLWLWRRRFNVDRFGEVRWVRVALASLGMALFGSQQAWAHHRGEVPPPPTPWWNAVLFSGVIAMLVLEAWMHWRLKQTPGSTTDDARAPWQRRREQLWSAAPLALLLLLGGSLLGNQGQQADRLVSLLPGNTSLTGAHAITGSAKQFAWTFDHGGSASPTRSGTELHVPVGEPVRLALRSQDVLHSFEVPAWHVQRDLIPGRSVTVVFKALQPGRYPLYCATLCGTGASEMNATLVAEPPDVYTRWLQAAGREALR